MKKILLAEDNDFVRMQLKTFLRDAGYDVVEASDGLTALNLIAPDIALALVDIHMEPIDGLEFVKAIRAKNIQTSVIFVTGDQNVNLSKQASDLGVETVLIKPVENDKLIAEIARAIK